MSELNRTVTGYTAIVKDKYVLCGSDRNPHWNEISKIGKSKIKQYRSIKVLLNNIGYHLGNYYASDFENDLYNVLRGKPECWYRGCFLDPTKPALHKPETLKVLIETGFLKVVKVTSIIEEEVIYPNEVITKLEED